MEVRGRCHLKKTEGKSVGSETLPESNRYTNLSYNCKSTRGEKGQRKSTFHKLTKKYPGTIGKETYKILMRD